MKKIINTFLITCLIAGALVSCKPDDDFQIGAPQNRIDQLTGTWKLESVTQIDLFAQSNNFVDPVNPELNLIQEDITEVVPFRDITVAFQSQAGEPTTFNINYGAAPSIFKLSSGTWEVDNISAPGVISLINGSENVPTRIGSVNNLSAGKMTLVVIRSQGTKPRIQYNYNFTKN